MADAIELDELKPVALKRKAIAQGDKVRYRVYKTPNEFVAVIAENALMAMKISGVATPHRILRDLPLTGSAVGPDTLVPHHTQPTAFMRPNKVPDAPPRFEAAREEKSESETFRPLPLADMRQGRIGQNSTIDVHTLLKALEDVTVIADVSPAQAPKPVETQESETSGPELTPEEVERLMSEPRA